MRFFDRHLWMIVAVIGLSLAWVGGCATCGSSKCAPCGCQHHHHMHYHLHCDCGCQCDKCPCPDGSGEILDDSCPLTK